MKNIYGRYSYYLRYINKIGTLPVTKNLTIDNLEIDRGTLQMGYREMRDSKKKNSIVSYISRVSMLFLLELWAGAILLQVNKTEEEDIRALIYIMNMRPEDTINTVRSVISGKQSLEFSVEGGGKLDIVFRRKPFGLFIKAMDVFSRLGVILKLFDEDDHDPVKREVARQFATEKLLEMDLEPLTRYYLAIHTVTAGSQAPFLPNPTNQPTNTTTQSSSDQHKEAKRSEASSQKAPSGAAQKAKRSAAIHVKPSVTKQTYKKVALKKDGTSGDQPKRRKE